MPNDINESLGLINISQINHSRDDALFAVTDRLCRWLAVRPKDRRESTTRLHHQSAVCPSSMEVILLFWEQDCL
jgi:hypothetical protein